MVKLPVCYRLVFKIMNFFQFVIPIYFLINFTVSYGQVLHFKTFPSSCCLIAAVNYSKVDVQLRVSFRSAWLSGIAIKDFPTTWKSNKKSWMTQEIMPEWLLEFDKKTGIQKRQLLLFLDNAGSHPRELNLKNVKIIFLPPNTTSICQPLDQGIIQNFKFYYRELILKHIITKIDEVQTLSQLSKTISVLEALYFIKTAWSKVNSTTIKNCFGKAGFKKSECCLVDCDPEDDLPLAKLAELFQNAKGLGATDPQSIEEFIAVDKNIQTEEENTVNDFVDFNEQEGPSEVDSFIIESEEDEIPAALTNIESINSYKEALNHICMLKHFSRDDFIAFQHLKNLESHGKASPKKYIRFCSRK